MNVNGQTLTYCTTLSAQVSSHCPSLAANCDEARHLILLCLSIELLGRLVNKARHKSHERRINVISNSFIVLGTCLQQHSITCSWSPPNVSKCHWGMSSSLCTCLRTCHRPKHRGDCSCFQSTGTTWLWKHPMDSNGMKNCTGFGDCAFPCLSLCWGIIFFLIVHVQLTSKVRVNGACRTRDNKCKSATRWSRTWRNEGVDGNVAQARSSWVLFMLVSQASPSSLELFQIKYAYIIL